MFRIRILRILCLVLSGCFIFVLAACGSTNPPTGGGSTPTTVGNTPTPTPTTPPTGATPTGGTVQMPPTSTSCPATGTGRAAVTAHLQLGSHQNVVYVYNVGTSDALNTSFLKRHDVTTGSDTTIATLNGAYILNSQVSADGQWVLFAAITGGLEKLQMIRMDGQGLQTLYCDTSSNNFQWSTNQQLIAFESHSGSTGFVKLLRVTDGTIETALSQPTNTPYAYSIRTWLDTTRLYLIRYDTDVPPDAVAVLDLKKGLNQTVSDLISVVKSQPGQFQDFDSSYDGTQMFVAHSACAYSCNGPGDITVLPALGGTGHTIYSNQTYSVVQVRAVTQQILLFRVGNSGFPNQSSGDISHNGLWMIHTDGTGLTRLTTDSANLFTYLNAASQYPWSNVSRDGNLYAAGQRNSQKSGSSGTATLFFGLLSGGSTTAFASTTAGTTSDLSVAGWTTM